MSVTLNDIAQAIGVRISTVSRVLNNKPNPIKISDETRTRILETAKAMGYHPFAAGRALATKRTGHIGFMLSASIAGGLSNVYFSLYLSGIERVCRRRGYGLNVSLYNLSNVDTFIFPSRIGQKTVDGLILTGYVEAAIVHRFRDFGIPCISLGQDTEVAELIPTLSVDDVDGLFQAVEYAAGLGHRRVLHSHAPTRRGHEVARLLEERVRANAATREVVITAIPPATGHCDYTAGAPLVEAWMNLPEKERPTVIMASDQTLQVVLRELDKRGLKCPRDVSLISNCDTSLCQYANPPLSAVDPHTEAVGEAGANLLIDHLTKKTPLGPWQSNNAFPCTFTSRESCGRPPER